MPAALKKLPKPTWPESSVPPGRRRASQQPPSRTPPAGAARTPGRNGCSMPSVFRPALRLTALRSAGLQQGSGSQTDPAGEGGGVPRTASCLGAQLRCPGNLAEHGTQHRQQQQQQQQRQEPCVYLYRKLKRALPTSHLGRTSAAGDGLNPVRTRRPARPSSSALLRSLRLTRPLVLLGCPLQTASIISPWYPSFLPDRDTSSPNWLQNLLLLLCTRPPGTPVFPFPPSPPSHPAGTLASVEPVPMHVSSKNIVYLICPLESNDKIRTQANQIRTVFMDLL